MFSPQVEWLPPEEFKDLSKYDEIAIDLETKDPELKTMGSGSVTSEGTYSRYSCGCNRLVWVLSYSVTKVEVIWIDGKRLQDYFQNRVLKTPAD